MKKLIIILITLHASLFTLPEANAQIINIPADYPTIQQGINAAVEGDTVLVQPGTYVENINYNGKNITVASLFLTTLDTSYISQTIIDGDSGASVVYFVNGEDSIAILCGFTITNGSAYRGGGIYCKNSSPHLKNLKVTGNVAVRGGGIFTEQSNLKIIETDIIKNIAIRKPGHGGTQRDAFGGGIRCNNSNPVLINVTVSNNVVIAPERAYGGGIYSYQSNLVLRNVLISDNTVEYNSYGQISEGGGICSYGELFLSNVTIKGNCAKVGGGIVGYSEIVFDSLNRCNIYSNKSANWGNDLFLNSYQVVFLDTFSVISPKAFHAYPIDNFSFNINAGKWDQAEADLFVSPQGNNANSGLSANQPLQNTWCAFSKILVDSLHPHTINLLEGTYSQTSNDEIFPFRIMDYISIIGESKNKVILDAEGRSNVIVLDYVLEIHIAGLTITGGTGVNGGGIKSNFSHAVIQNTIITNNATHWHGQAKGGGVFCNHSVLELQSIIIRNNSAYRGGGIYLLASNAIIQNCIIDSNYAELGGGIFSSDGASPVLKKTTIKDNTASSLGGGYYCSKSVPNFDQNNRSNIYFNKAIQGNDLYSDTLVNVIVDTFTVLYPTEFHAEPISNYTFDILHGKWEQEDADLFVSPQGDNSNSGLSPDKPLKTIRCAISRILPDSINQNTIQILDGTYSTSTNNEFFPINIIDYINLQGVSASNSILDAEGQSVVIRIDCSISNYITGLTITGGSSDRGGGINCTNANPVLNDLSILDNVAKFGGGVYCYNSNPSLQNITISNNKASTGAGIYLENSSPDLTNVNISNNRLFSFNSESDGGGIYCKNSHPTLNGVIISGNSAGNGGGIYCNASNPSLQNVEIAGNTAVRYRGTGGGGISCINSNPVLQQVRILDNEANAFGMVGGGGIYCYNSYPILFEVNISGNLATNGGGLYLDNSSPELQNVIIENNTSNQSSGYIGGGGMCCRSSSPILQNVQIISNYSRGNGGGIACILSSRPSFLNVNISDNSTREYDNQIGGGIYCDSSFLDLKNVSITNNYAPIGGGIGFFDNSISSLKFVNIKNNSAYTGGGIYCSSSSPLFDSNERCNIYFNNAVKGNDLYSDTLMNVIVDTFSVLYPTDMHAEPIENFTFDILHGKIEQIDADLYVSPYGQNTNTGLTSDEPLKTIRVALSKILADSIHPHTIHLLDGTYSASTNGEIFPINILDYIYLSGESRDRVILDAQKQSGVLIIENNKATNISRLTITGGSSDRGGGINCTNANPVLNDLSILDNVAKFGGGVYCYNSNPDIKNVTISNDSASRHGSGIYCGSSNPNIHNVIISDNTVTGSSSNPGGGIYCDNSSPIITNTTISNNYCNAGGAAIGCGDNSHPKLINCIIWDNIGSAIMFFDIYTSNSISTTYSDIEGGYEGIVTNNNGTVFWYEGNLNENPLFIGSGDHPFSLSDGSPCIDIGTPDTTGLHLPLIDIAGNPRIWNERIDMGAYEWNNLGYDELQVAGCGLRVFPNPSSGTAKIRYRVQDAGYRMIGLFSIEGIKIRELVNEEMPAGEHEIEIDVSNLPDGVYVVRLQVGSESAIAKLLVVH